MRLPNEPGYTPGSFSFAASAMILSMSGIRMRAGFALLEVLLTVVSVAAVVVTGVYVYAHRSSVAPIMSSGVTANLGTTNRTEQLNDQEVSEELTAVRDFDTSQQSIVTDDDSVMDEVLEVSDDSGLSRSAPVTTVCDNLNDRATAIQAKYATLKDRVAGVWAVQDKKSQGFISNEDSQVRASRQKADDQRQLNFAKLEDRPSTAAGARAVATYVRVITGAANTRRAAVSAARTAFRDELARSVSTRRALITDQANGLSGAVRVAYATAETSCQGGVGKHVVSSTLQASLQLAHRQFADARKGDSTVRAQVQSFAQARNQSIQVANTTFVLVTQRAALQLRTAFVSDSI